MKYVPGNKYKKAEESDRNSIMEKEEAEPCGHTFKRRAWSGPRGHSYNSCTILAGNKTE
jgi:hypothetical protein